MRNYNFKIPVADILKESSTHDTIQFLEKFSTFLPQLVDPGISATIELQGMDKSSLLITINKAQALCSSACDACGEKVKYTIAFENKEIKCFFEKDSAESVHDDDILYIDPAHKVVDLEEFLVQSFLLADEIVHVCTTCEKKREKLSEENDDSHATIVWK